MFKGWREEDGALKETEDHPGREEDTKGKGLRIPAKNACKE